LGIVNAFVIVRPDHLTLIDCGMPGNADKIETALAGLGCSLQQVKHILVTHCHPDHAGSLAEIQRRAPQAKTYMHAEDACWVRAGVGIPPDRPLRPAPGFHNQVLYHGFVARISPKIEAAQVDRTVYDGQRLPIAEGVTVIHAPGHSRGQVCFLWHSDQGVLFAGDTACCILTPSYSIVYEDFELGKETLAQLSTFPFQYACFGHGKSIVRSADRRFARAFNSPPASRLVPAAEGLARQIWWEEAGRSESPHENSGNRLRNVSATMIDDRLAPNRK
jgi:glyoxylase-like metal-dependent hydrolase (beta-lactamase superfamily II)